MRVKREIGGSETQKSPLAKDMDYPNPTLTHEKRIEDGQSQFGCSPLKLMFTTSYGMKSISHATAHIDIEEATFLSGCLCKRRRYPETPSARRDGTQKTSVGTRMTPVWYPNNTTPHHGGTQMTPSSQAVCNQIKVLRLSAESVHLNLTLITGRVSGHYSPECRGHSVQSDFHPGNVRFRNRNKPDEIFKYIYLSCFK